MHDASLINAILAHGVTRLITFNEAETRQTNRGQSAVGRKRHTPSADETFRHSRSASLSTPSSGYGIRLDESLVQTPTLSQEGDEKASRQNQHGDMSGDKSHSIH